MTLVKTAQRFANAHKDIREVESEICQAEKRLDAFLDELTTDAEKISGFSARIDEMAREIEARDKAVNEQMAARHEYERFLQWKEDAKNGLILPSMVTGNIEPPPKPIDPDTIEIPPMPRPIPEKDIESVQRLFADFESACEYRAEAVGELADLYARRSELLQEREKAARDFRAAYKSLCEMREHEETVRLQKIAQAQRELDELERKQNSDAALASQLRDKIGKLQA